MGRICHHTTENRGNKDRLHFPTYGDGINNYFGKGYYFWDNNLRQAEYWGKRRYAGRYYVFLAELTMDKNLLFDTTDRNDIGWLVNVVREFKKYGTDLSEFYLSSIIRYFFEIEDETGKPIFPFLYAKGMDHRKPSLFMRYSARSWSGFDADPVCFYCIFKKENVNLVSFYLLKESPNS